MDDLALVRRHERVRHLPDDDEHVLGRPRLVRAEQLAQRRPLHELHDHEELAVDVGDAEVEHRHHVRRVDRGDGEDLALEALDDVAVSEYSSFNTLSAQSRPLDSSRARKTCANAPFPDVRDHLVAVLVALADADGHAHILSARLLLPCAREAGDAWSQCKLRNCLRSVTLATQRNASSRIVTARKHVGAALVQLVQPLAGRGTRGARACCCRPVLANASPSSSTRTPAAFGRRVIDDLAELVPPHDLYVSSNLDHSRQIAAKVVERALRHGACSAAATAPSCSA